jgi:hypothetical protein
MTAYNPPNFNLPIFDSKAFSDVNESEFLDFPTAQGVETFPNGLIGNLNGTATNASNITTNATTQITQHYINFSDNATTGTGAVQKVSGLSVFPNATTYQGNAYTGATLLSNNMVTNNLTSFQANNLILSSNSASGEIRLNLQNATTRIATISSTGLAMATGKTISGGLAGGVAGAIVFQSAVGTTGFTNAGTSGQSLLSAGSSTPIWGTPALATAATTATTATNIAGGGAGRVAFNNGVGTTSFTDAGTSGQSLLSAGTGTPIWGTPALATSATNIANGLIGQIPYQTGAGATSFLTSVATNSKQVLTSGGAGAPSWNKNYGNLVGVDSHLNFTLDNAYTLNFAGVNKVHYFDGQTGQCSMLLATDGASGVTNLDSVIIVNRSTTYKVNVYNGAGSQPINLLFELPPNTSGFSNRSSSITCIYVSAISSWIYPDRSI